MKIFAVSQVYDTARHVFPGCVKDNSRFGNVSRVCIKILGYVLMGRCRENNAIISRVRFLVIGKMTEKYRIKYFDA